ncbi:hypothetical protein [Bradyrhizobium sp. CCBAU 11445]|uniref:hypothetical protein n=1 Tax=Bradyrhizobium sp. CCBAU 11445 TaxID=1630896 RepID=UPI00230607E7|nr:hypothetical protein [Bradyrhizobium sp. CCBAU 11445]
MRTLSSNSGVTSAAIALIAAPISVAKFSAHSAISNASQRFMVEGCGEKRSQDLGCQGLGPSGPGLQPAPTTAAAILGRGEQGLALESLTASIGARIGMTTTRARGRRSATSLVNDPAQVDSYYLIN